MTPEEILTLVDFRYLTDVLTKEDARQILSKWYPTRSERETQVHQTGYPAYTTSIGWLGYVSCVATVLVRVSSRKIIKGGQK